MTEKKVINSVLLHTPPSVSTFFGKGGSLLAEKGKNY